MIDKIKEAIQIFHMLRPMQWTLFGFVLWLTLDFHEFYKANALKFEDWQMTAVAAYAALIWGLVKIIAEGVLKKREKDET